jgi:hypothetical protein
MKLELFNLIKILHNAVIMLFFGFKNKYFKLINKDYSYTKFHSQFGEDRYIAENIEFLQRGAFIDIGAGHPTYLSNSYFFERMVGNASVLMPILIKSNYSKENA